MDLNDALDHFDPESIAFERWCGDRIQVLPDPKLWKAILKAKRGFERGKTVIIRRQPCGGTRFLMEIGVMAK